MSKKNIRVSITAAVMVAMLAAAGWFGYDTWHLKQLDHARTDSVATARKTVEGMFSYDFNSVDKALPKVADNLTGGFKDDYLKLVNESIAPGAKEKQLTVIASTQAGGVIDVDTKHAKVMLFLNQMTTSKDNPKATASGSRVRVDLEKSGDHWLVSEVTPI
ncbi:h domain protein [Nocardia sp. NPDC059764]|uniref:h domain protein n=1 Tax=Nocardia sp. NPDC059764 TaxID=3346939 RepID=UPI003664DF9B